MPTIAQRLTVAARDDIDRRHDDARRGNTRVSAATFSRRRAHACLARSRRARDQHVRFATLAFNFPPLTGPVVDQANVTSAQSRMDLEAKLTGRLVDGPGRRRGVTSLRSPNRLDQAASLSPTSRKNVRTLESTHCFS